MPRVLARGRPGLRRADRRHVRGPGAVGSGPVVAASVKSDLLRDTQKQRNERGRVWRIDPTGSVGGRPSTWSPLSHCADWTGANRMAADLAETAKADGTTADGEFWYATAADIYVDVCTSTADNEYM